MKIGILGNGFVGSSLAWGLSPCHEILVYDRNPERSSHSLEDTVNESDVIFICVPTPPKPDWSIDLSIIRGAVESIANIDKNKLIVIKSTVLPGTCRGLSKKFGVNVASNPEFLTERRAKFDFINPAQILIGADREEDAEKLMEVYKARFKTMTYTVTDTVTSELSKYMLNCFFSVKVSFANLFREICEKENGDWEKLQQAFVADARVTDSHIDVPGPDGKLGFGGHCFPKDLNALMAFAKKNNINTQLLDGAWEYNKEIRDEAF